MPKNQVFLSYRHESPEHARAVKRLGELLRQAKLPVMLDQFFLDENPGGPNEGWPKWCEDCANDSDCVVIIGSDGWFTAYEDPASGPGGYGAASEAQLFRQTLWDDKGNNERLRVAFLHQVATDKVPVRLRAWHQFRPFDADDQLNQLVRWIASRLHIQEVALPTVQWPAPVAFEPDCADRRETEWPLICDLLAGRSRERILLIEGESGLGKSELLQQTTLYAGRLGIPVARVNLKGGGMDVSGILGQFQLDLEAHLPNFCRDGASKTHLLRRDLRALRRPVIAIFDSFEDAADNRTVTDWLTQHLLAEVETALGFAVIVAGKRVPDRASAPWRDLARHQRLNPIEKLELWEPWVDRKFPGFKSKGAHLQTILLLARGNPSIVASSCRAIAGG